MTSLAYSPGLAPCNVWLFCKVKKIMKAKQFELGHEVDTIKDTEERRLQELLQKVA